MYEPAEPAEEAEEPEELVDEKKPAPVDDSSEAADDYAQRLEKAKIK